jgi:hypothetical protein
MAIPKPRLVIADNRFIYKRYSFHMDNRFNFHNREKHMTQLLDLFQCKQFHPCAYTGGHSILYAVRLTLPAIISDPIKYIDDKYFDVCGASGFFQCLPVSADHHNDKHFLGKGDSQESNQAALDATINYENSYTTIDLMFLAECTIPMRQEFAAINNDLNEFVKMAFATKWEQIPFFPGK